MCGRFALSAPASAITEVFQVDILPDLLPRYNVAPTQQVPAIVAADGIRSMRRFRWGLIPPWAKDKKISASLINARGESVHEKPSFRSAFKRRRCLIPADGFYEWKRDGKLKIPHLIGLTAGLPFAIAGLWERWHDPETNEDLHSCCLVTTGPNSLMERIHDRMPVILPQSAWDRWLDPNNDDVVSLRELLVPYPAELMTARTVSSRVNDARKEGPDNQRPYDQSA